MNHTVQDVVALFVITSTTLNDLRTMYLCTTVHYGTAYETVSNVVRELGRVNRREGRKGSVTSALVASWRFDANLSFPHRLEPCAGQLRIARSSLSIDLQEAAQDLPGPPLLSPWSPGSPGQPHRHMH